MKIGRTHSVSSVAETRDEERFSNMAIVCLLGLIALYLFLVPYGVKASVFPDETFYSFGTRLQSFAEASIPSYLYYAVYSVVGLFGDDFLSAVQFLNALFLTLSGVFVYLVARMGCGFRLSAFITAVSLLFPSSIYVAYFTPEIPYRCAFWGFVWFIMRRGNTESFGFAALCGILAGIMALIKIHAIFLLPGIFLFLIMLDWNGISRNKIRQYIGLFFILSLSFLATRFILGYAFAGERGLSLFGTSYSTALVDRITLPALFAYIAKTADSAFGHIMGLALVFGFPLTLMLAFIFSPKTGSKIDISMRRIAILCIALLVSLIAAIALYTAILEQLTPGAVRPETTRIHWRYYSFAFPLFLVFAGYAYTRSRETAIQSTGPMKLLAIPFLGLAAYALMNGFPGYAPAFAYDCPELGIFFTPLEWRGWGTLLGCLAILPCLAGLVDERSACRLFLWLFLPVYSIYSIVMVHHFLTPFAREPSVDEEMATYLKWYLGDEKSDLALIDRDAHVSFGLLYYLDNAAIPLSYMVTEDVLDMQRVRPGTKWLVINGPIRVPREFDKYNRTLTAPDSGEGGFHVVLVRIADYSYSVDFRGKEIHWPIHSIERSENEIAVQYGRDLPPRIRIALQFSSEQEPCTAEYRVTIPGMNAPLIINGSHESRHEYVIQGSRLGSTITMERSKEDDEEAADNQTSIPVRLEVTPF